MVYEYEGKTERDAIEAAAADLGLEQDQFDVEIIETQKNGLFKKGHVKIRVHTDDVHAGKERRENVAASRDSLFADPLPKDEFEKKLIDFICSVVRKMGYECSAEVMFREEYKIGISSSSQGIST